MAQKLLTSICFVLVLGAALTSVASAATDPNLIGWWRFDDNANDSSSLGNTGTLMGDATYGPGKWGRALKLSGNGDYFNCGNDPNWDVTSSFTVMAWIKGPYNYADGTGGDTYIVDKGISWKLYCSSQATAEFDCNGPLPTTSVGNRTEVYLNIWSHVAGVYDANEGKIHIYIDTPDTIGERSDTNDATGNVNTDPSHEMWIGADSNEPGNYFMTYIDDVRIYNRALTLDEIRGIRNDPCYVIARNPVPADEGTVGVNVSSGTTTLKWEQAPGATSHDVYFGSGNPPSFIHNQTGADNNSYEPNGVYDPDGLRVGETSYWRINEVNSGGTYEGVVWRFTVQDYLLVDDFEFYADTADLITTWPGQGAAAGYVKLKYNPPLPEPWAQHQGNQYMSVGYWNNYTAGTYSEAKNTFGTAQDWASTGVKSLTVWFTGSVANESDKIYLTLDDNAGKSATVTFNDSNGNTDVNAIKEGGWREWNIDLEDFPSANDVNLACVKGIHVGIGDRYAAGDPTIGFVYFDDMMLYKPRCVGQHRPDTDLTNDDCVMDYRDVGRMSDTWLDTACRPVLHYEFDINDVNIAHDSSGYGYDGTVNGGSWTEGTIGSGAWRFHGDYIEVPVEALSRVRNQITISLWTLGNADHMPPAPPEPVYNNTAFQATWMESWSYDDKILGCYIPGNNGRIYFDSGNGAAYGNWNRCITDARDETDYANQWNHWAFTKNCDTGYIKIYLNGAEMYSANGMYESMFGARQFWIGRKPLAPGGETNRQPYYGNIDDFRIYNRALSQADIAKIMTNETLPTPPIAEIAGDNRVNFKDYAVLSDAWLEEELWP